MIRDMYSVIFFEGDSFFCIISGVKLSSIDKVMSRKAEERYLYGQKPYIYREKFVIEHINNKLAI